TESVLARIAERNPEVNAVVELSDAMRQAKAADEAIAKGERSGPLLGVPITIKEGFNVVGMHTTWGNPVFKDYVADWDATIVRRFKEAGAVIVGKTNVAFMMADFAGSQNEVYGATQNPWDAELSPGGSSGGAAAALACGMSFLDYGSDLAGSIRIPASFCGIYGLKPTAGIVDPTGFQPP